MSSPLHLYLLLARDGAAVLHIRARLLAVHAAHGVVGGGGVHLVEAAAAEGALSVELGRVVRVLPTLENVKIIFLVKHVRSLSLGVKILCLSTGLLQGLSSGSKKSKIFYKCPTRAPDRHPPREHMFEECKSVISAFEDLFEEGKI